MDIIKDSNFAMMSFGRTETGTPKVDEKFGSQEWINFGEKNDFPQELLRLFQNASSIHSGIIKRKVDMIAGQGWKYFPELEELLANDFSENDLNEVVYRCAFDIVIFGGYYLNLLYNSKGVIAQVEHVPFEKVRVAKPNQETEKVEGYFVSKDWLKHKRAENTPEFIDRFDPSKGKKSPSQILQVKIYTPGMDYYPLPTYMPAINWIKLDYEISTFHLKNVQNGLMPGMIIVNKMGVPPAQEREAIYNEVKQRYSGADNAGDFIMVFAESAEKAPEFIPVQLNATDQRFKDLSLQIDNTIMRAHNFTSAIAGIETAGKLGSRQELEEQLEMLQTTVISPIQTTIERSFNKVAEANGIQELFELIEYTMFKADVSAKANVITNNINGLSPLVANKVLESMSPDEIRALVGLQPGVIAPEIPTDALPAEAPVEMEGPKRSKLTETVGGVQGILSIKQAVIDGVMDHSSACALLQIMFGYSEEECLSILGSNTTIL